MAKITFNIDDENNTTISTRVPDQSLTEGANSVLRNLDPRQPGAFDAVELGPLMASNAPVPLPQQQPADDGQEQRVAEKVAQIQALNELQVPQGNDIDEIENLISALLNDPRQKQLQAQFQERSQDLISQRQDSIAALQRQLEAERARGRTPDLRPLAAFVDSITGSKLTQGFGPGESAAQQQNRLAGLQRAISQEQGAVTNAELNALKAQLAGTSSLRLVNAARRGKQFALKRLDKFESDFKKSVNKDVIKPLNKAAPKLNQIEAALNSGNFRRINATLSVFAREVNQERGALSDTDVARTIFPDIQQRVANLKETIGAEGKVSQANLRALKSALEDYRRALRQASLEQLQGIETLTKFGNSSVLFNEGGAGPSIINQVTQQINRVASPGASKKLKGGKKPQTPEEREARRQELLNKARGR